jgi:hypothetical protein
MLSPAVIDRRHSVLRNLAPHRAFSRNYATQKDFKDRGTGHS